MSHQYGDNNSYYNPNPAQGGGGYGYEQGPYEGGGGYNQHTQPNSGNQGGVGYGNQQQSPYGGGGDYNQHTQPNSGNQHNPYGNQGDGYGHHQSPSSGGGDYYQHTQHNSGNQQSHENDHGGRRYSGDLSGAADHAAEHSSSSEDKSLFNSALKFLQERTNKDDNHNGPSEDDAKKAHNDIYGSGDSKESHSSKSIGAGAAVQALKMFAGSGSNGSSSDGGMDKNKFIGLAMAQAGKLFDDQKGNGKVSGDKQSAVNSAAEMALKMYMENQVKKSGAGGAVGLLEKYLGGSHSSGGGGGGGGAAGFVQNIMGGNDSGSGSHSSGGDSGGSSAAGLLKMAGKAAKLF